MGSLIRQICRNFSNLSITNAINIGQKQNLLAAGSFSVFNSQLRRYSNAPTLTPTAYEIIDQKEEHSERQGVFNKINNQIAEKKQGRLFAVVHIVGKQFKITEGDLVIIEGYWPPDAGDKLSLDKVMLLGSKDFTLVGRPILDKSLVKITATVIEKSLSHTKTHFKKKRRKQYLRINFLRIPQTMLRINSIEFTGELNNPKDVTGLDTAIF